MQIVSTKAGRAPGYVLTRSRLSWHGSWVLAIVFLVASRPTVAMTLSQMRALPGGSLIEMRVLRAFRAYGLPAAILDRGKDLRNASTAPSVTWHAVQMRLGRGTWKLIYQGSRLPKVNQERGWRNPDPQIPKGLPDVSKLELLASGGVGIVTIDSAAHKTTYSVPRDLLKAHKIVTVMTRFAIPVQPRMVVDRYGHQCEFVAGEKGRPVMRYWVLKEVNMLPLALYAVDFDLSHDRTEVVGFTIRDATAMYVRRRFEAYYQHWMDLISD